MFYSKITGGFYDPVIHGHDIPADAVEISDAEHASLQTLQSLGHRIQADPDGYPIAVFVVIEAVMPSACSPAQGLVALFALKQITEDHVLDAIAQIPDPVQQYTARIGYQRATIWERGSPTMLAMAQLLQLSDEDLDALFSYAVTVQV
ncbi:hypothetical protein [Comamonas sp. Y33R10-2]|uniref:hypothetical protein n=1 Tax=Comamonas sp. Y33R10-2 TaxID=2853257 RepID=UPI0021080CAD|nr:hypothetical protein [Comamonas sp. Y33R10-2]